jgi:serine/threonine-protein kinase
MSDIARLGRYRLLRRIAVGGVAEVYLAEAEGLAGFAKRVVIKRLHPEHARDQDLVSMFTDEARLGALLHHRHIVEVYDVGSAGSDTFIVMEHVPGRDLRDLLDARPGQPLPLPVALAIVEAVAAGLHHAHEQRDAGGQLLGVVHRDVSPANVLLGWDGTVKLSDFGVAKWAAQRSRTEQGTLKGKLGYMSPEQGRGEALDRRSDVFALAVLLYELTTGAQPFRVASDFETLSAIVAGRYQPPSAIRPGYPAGLEAIVDQGLAVDPAARFPDAAALGAAVAAQAAALGAPGTAADIAACLRERFPAGEQESAPEAGVPETAGPAPERTRTDAAAGPAGTGAAAAGPGVAGAAAGRTGRRTAWALVAAAVAAAAIAVLARGRPPAPAAPARAGSAGPASAPVSAAPPPPTAPPPPPVARPAAAPAIRPATPGARRRPAGKPRDPHVVWDPDSPVLP